MATRISSGQSRQSQAAEGVPRCPKVRSTAWPGWKRVCVKGDWGLPGEGVHGHGDHHGEGGLGAGLTSVRTAHHKGHEIRIETSYNVTIDGRQLDTGLEVLDNGTVHYHGLPQYAVPSAVELVKRIIDYFGMSEGAGSVNTELLEEEHRRGLNAGVDEAVIGHQARAGQPPRDRSLRRGRSRPAAGRP